MNHFKKRLSVLTAVALTLLMSLSACETIDSNPVPTITEPTTESISLTQMTTTTTQPTVPTTTTTAETTTTTTAPTETTTTPETSETTVPETSASEESTVVTTASGKWTETAVNKTMYTTQACYSRAEAIIGATIVGEYAEGTQVSVIAVTNTGYYKLADGSFIHSDYLSESGTAATTTQAPATLPAPAPDTDGPTYSGSTAFEGDYTSRYFWDQLTNLEKDLYAKIVAKAMAFDTSMIEVNDMTYNDVLKVYFLVFNMEPQLFWLDTGANVTSFGIGLRYVNTKQEAATIKNEIDRTTNSIMTQANKYTSVWNKLLVFYNYIILNNDSNEISANTAAACGIENGLRPGSGDLQCNGYAKTMQYLCDISGIECLTLPGMNSHGTTHAWNKVKVGGKWYIIDATWADPASNGGDFISHPFFMVPDSWTVNSHLMPNQKTLNSGAVITYFTPPAATDSSLNYFKVMNREYTGVDAGYAGICAEIKRAIEAGELTAEVRITDAASYQTLITSEYKSAVLRYARTVLPGVNLKPQTTNRADSHVLQFNIVYP